MTPPLFHLRVFRTGLLSRFGHDLQFSCARFLIEWEGDRVAARFWTGSLTVDGALYRGRVRPELLGDDDIQKIRHIACSRILRCEEFPEARFDGRTRVVDGVPTVDGSLVLLGRRLALPELKAESAFGRIKLGLTLRPSRWGVEEVRAFGGALRLEDRIEVELDVPAPRDVLEEGCHTWSRGNHPRSYESALSQPRAT